MPINTTQNSQKDGWLININYEFIYQARTKHFALGRNKVIGFFLVLTSWAKNVSSEVVQ